MTTLRRSALPSIQRDALLCLLAFALWFAVSLGIVHRTLHDPSVRHAALTSATASKASPGGHVLSALFGDHTDADCRLYDQLSHGAAVPCVPAVILPVMLPSATFAYLQGEALARWVALFDARGPPFIR